MSIDEWKHRLHWEKVASNQRARAEAAEQRVRELDEALDQTTTMANDHAASVATTEAKLATAVEALQWIDVRDRSDMNLIDWADEAKQRTRQALSGIEGGDGS